jgi:Aspartyl protease
MSNRGCSLLLLLLALAGSATTVPATAAETHCPGNVASVPSRFVNGHQIILPVSINHTGPYSFLLDSGTQITMIDSSLAAQLHAATQGAAVVAGLGPRQSASIAQLDLIEAGSRAVANQNVLVYNLQNLRPSGQLIQGILGEDFLRHFDVLIDNAHRLLCLDNSAVMRAEVKGPHIPLVTTAQPDGVALPGLLIVAVRLSDAMRPVRLLLDSGTETPKLYNISQYMVLQVSHDVPLRGRGVDGGQQILLSLPPQDIKIGSLELPRVPFFALAGIQKDASEKGFDGVLATALFRRVFVDHADHFAVLDAR